MAEAEPRRGAATLLRAAAAQAGRLLAIILTLTLLGIALVAIAAGLQADRDEARRADVLVVVAPAVPAESFIDHTFELYRRGYAPQLLVAGPGRAQLIGALDERGLPASAMAEAEGAALPPDEIAAVRGGQEAGAASALVVAQPEDLLLTMKMARDMGLRAYGSPPPGRTLDLLTLLRASGDYWGYVLLRR